MEGALVPGVGADGPLGVGGVEWSEVVLGTGETLLGPALRGREQRLSITGQPGKGQAAERESEGVVVVTTAGTTQPGPSEGPLLHRCTTKDWETS